MNEEQGLLKTGISQIEIYLTRLATLLLLVYKHEFKDRNR